MNLWRLCIFFSRCYISSYIICFVSLFSFFRFFRHSYYLIRLICLIYIIINVMYDNNAVRAYFAFIFHEMLLPVYIMFELFHPALSHHHHFIYCMLRLIYLVLILIALFSILSGFIKFSYLFDIFLNKHLVLIYYCND